MHTDGCAVCIVDVYHKVTVPLLGHNLRTVKSINMLYSVDCLGCTDAVNIIGKCKVLVTFCGSFKPSALPSKGVVGSVVIR